MIGSSARPAQLGAREQRIKRWAQTGRTVSVGTRTTPTSAALRTTVLQRRSESLFTQANRTLHTHLLHLSEERQKTIDQRNFDQKLFANKQALKHRTNPAVASTLKYVRQCCKYADGHENGEHSFDPSIFLEENAAGRRNRSRSLSPASPVVKRSLSRNARLQTSASLAETFLRHNKKHLESHGSTPITSENRAAEIPAVVVVDDDETHKRHVQFRIQTDNEPVPNPSSFNANERFTRRAVSAHGMRSARVASREARASNSAPLMRSLLSPTGERDEECIKTESTKRASTASRSQLAKRSLDEFRLHPERFLSASNRYLPLLRRQVLEMQTRGLLIKRQREKSDSSSSKKQHKLLPPSLSRLSDASDLVNDDAKSFLSEDADSGKIPSRPATSMSTGPPAKRASSKLDLMETIDNTPSAHAATMARLRDREYARLQALIRANSMGDLLAPFSAVKTDEFEREQEKFVDATKYARATARVIRIRPLGDILHAIDSLRVPEPNDARARRQLDMESNLTKLDILIF